MADYNFNPTNGATTPVDQWTGSISGPTSANKIVTIPTKDKYLDRNIVLTINKPGTIGFNNISLTTTNKDSESGYIPIVVTAGYGEKQWSNALTIPTQKSYSVTSTAGASSSARTGLTYTHNNYTRLNINGTSTTDSLATIYPGKAFGSLYIGNWTVQSRTTRGYLGLLSLLGYNTNTSYPDYLGVLNIGNSAGNNNSQVGTINNYGIIGNLAQTGTITTLSGNQTVTKLSGTLQATVNSSTTGNLKVNAYIDNGTTSLSGVQNVIVNGKWNYNNITPGASAQGPFYGETKVAAMPSGSIGNATSVPSGYTENTTVIVPSKGYLKINAGYIPNTVISLDQILDGKADTAGTANYNIVTGKIAYNVDGEKLTGTMPEYAGLFDII